MTENPVKGEIRGTGVVAGVAYAPVVWVRPRPELPESGTPLRDDEREAETERFLLAADTVADRLQQRADNAQDQAAEVLKATVGMVRDRGWQKTVRKNISTGQRAEYAVVGATDRFVSMFEHAGGLMAERTTDLRDIRDRVIAELRGEDEPGLPGAQVPSILFADDLAPADTAGLDPELFVAIVTEVGGPTSHTAIIARQLGVPCIVAVGKELHGIPAGEKVQVDGAAGVVHRGVDEAEAMQAVEASRRQQELISAWEGPAQTSDGHRVQLLANVADAKAAVSASKSQAEGVGLYRTELSFLSTTSEPSVDEQAELYGKVFGAFGTSKVVVRTLDAGSDKPIAYATLASEENPALGVRGLRIALGNEGLMTRQLDGIAKAARERPAESHTWVMAPMVATADEAEWFAGLCRERGLVPGAMIEVPAAALMADAIMPFLDFVSIGTNDLTQYAMAADRMSPQLAYLTDPWQPAVLKLIELTCQGGDRHGVPVGVCGEAAADPILACVLTGMGVTSLSAASNAIAGVGAQLGQVTIDQCREMAAAALAARGPVEAKASAQAIASR